MANSSSKLARHTGGIWDGDVGNYRFGARAYDAWKGRWWSKDPSKFDGGLNFYVYAENDPVNLIDADGMKPNDVFTSADAAAIDAAKEKQWVSFRDGVEYSTVIIQRADGTFTYPDFRKGWQVGSTLYSPGPGDFYPIDPGSTIVAPWHTHAAYASFDPVRYPHSGMDSNDENNCRLYGEKTYIAGGSDLSRIYITYPGGTEHFTRISIATLSLPVNYKPNKRSKP